MDERKVKTVFREASGAANKRRYAGATHDRSTKNVEAMERLREQ